MFSAPIFGIPIVPQEVSPLHHMAGNHVLSKTQLFMTSFTKQLVIGNRNSFACRQAVTFFGSCASFSLKLNASPLAELCQFLLASKVRQLRSLINN